MQAEIERATTAAGAATLAPALEAIDVTKSLPLGRERVQLCHESIGVASIAWASGERKIGGSRRSGDVDVASRILR